MNFKIDIEDFNQELVYNGIKNKTPISEGILEAGTEINHSFGSFDFKEIQVEVGTILMSKYNLKNSLRLKGAVRQDIVEMHFNLGNDIILGENSKNKAIFNKMHHNLLGLNAISGFIDFSNIGNFKTFDIHIPIDFVKKWQGNNEELDAFIETFEKKRPAFLYPQNMPITPTMQTVIYQIASCPYIGISRSVFIESKVQELFCLQIEQGKMYKVNKHNIACKFSHSDIEKIYFAKLYIENNVSKHVSIKQLSEISGVNQQKLKEGFKNLFDTTVFAFAQKQRMIFAKQMLLDGALVTEVYDKVGYADVSSFSHAFKLFFGFSPVKCTQL